MIDALIDCSGVHVPVLGVQEDDAELLLLQPSHLDAEQIDDVLRGEGTQAATEFLDGVEAHRLSVAHASHSRQRSTIDAEQASQAAAIGQQPLRHVRNGFASSSGRQVQVASIR